MDKLNKIFLEAIYNQDYDKVSKCIDAGADFNRAHENGDNPWKNIRSAPCSRTATELSLGDIWRSGFVCHTNNFVRSSLHWASYCGNEKIVKLLLKAAANTKNQDELVFGDALTEACINGHTEIVILLLPKLDKYRDRVEYAAQLLLYACAHGNLGVVKVLLEKYSESEYTVGKYNEVTRTFIETVTVDGNRALHIACQSGNSDMVKILLESQKKITVINAKNDEGNTPLNIACQHGNLNKVNVLLKHNCNIKADIYMGNKRGYSPLDEACDHHVHVGDAMDVIKALCKTHYEIKFKNPEKYSKYHIDVKLDKAKEIESKMVKDLPRKIEELEKSLGWFKSDRERQKEKDKVKRAQEIVRFLKNLMEEEEKSNEDDFLNGLIAQRAR